MLSDRVLPELNAGQIVNLGLEGTEGLKWYSVRLEAHERGEGRVSVAWPAEENGLVPVKPGQTALLEASSVDDALYAVEMQVEHAYQAGAPALILLPETPWTRQQRRSDVRFQVLITPTVAEVLTPEGWQTLKTTIRNLSAGGLLLRAESELQSGQRLDLGFALPPKNAEVRVRVDVRRVVPVQRGSKHFWEAGGQFNDPKPKDKEAIIRFIFDQQREAARRQRGLA